MNLSLSSLPSRRALAIASIALSLVACGGSSKSTLGASFTASSTAQTPRLVKLVQKAKSGTRVVVQAVIYGPDTTLDMYSFAFDVKIGNPAVAKFVAGSAVAGNALVPTAGQTVEAIADLGTLPGGGTDNSLVVVGVTKLGGPPGNGIAGASAVIVELAFDVVKSGTSTLTLTGSPNPQALDSLGVPIGSITFDAASASIKGVSSGGGGY